LLNGGIEAWKFGPRLICGSTSHSGGESSPTQSSTITSEAQKIIIIKIGFKYFYTLNII